MHTQAAILKGPGHKNAVAALLRGLWETSRDGLKDSIHPCPFIFYVQQFHKDRKEQNTVFVKAHF